MSWNPELRVIVFEKNANSVIAVAYIDPDNYQTDVSAGAEFKYRLLFMLLVSNLIAIYLQASLPSHLLDFS